MTGEYRHREALVSTDWLASHLDDPDLKVFECTTYLHYLPAGKEAPYRVVSGRADYDQGHIPNAGFLDLQNELSDPNSPAHLRFTLPPLADVADAFARRGIGDGSRVVLYSRGRLVWATRVWWMLRAIGFDRAAVLDGGWEKWVREGRPIANESPEFAPAKLALRPRPETFIAKAAVQAAMREPRACLINALEPDLHRGENPRYGRPGRIPGSANVPASRLVDTDTNTFVPAEQAAVLFEGAGADPSRRTVLYCGGGIAATLDAFVLYQLGYGNLSIYDASMSEWARDPSLPIETD